MKQFAILLLTGMIFSLPVTAERITLLATGQTFGLMEKCGCNADKGGLQARAGFVAGLRAKGTPFILLDNGNFLPEKKDPINSAVGEIVIAAMDSIGYDLVLLGANDLNYGYDYLSKAGKNTDPRFPFISTNITASKETFAAPYSVKEINGVKIGFVGITNLNKGKTFAGGEFTITDPSPAVKNAIDGMKKENQVDAVVLLVHEAPNVVGKWLKDYDGPRIDLALTLDFELEVQKEKDTFIVNAPAKGYDVGKIELELEKGKGVTQATCERIALDPEKYKHDGMREFLVASYKKTIARLELGIDGPYPLQELEMERESSNGYVGAVSCLGCHADQYAQWEKTRHAAAFNDLLEGNRFWVPECVVCHVTGYGNERGFVNFTETRELLGVQCETCHGPGMRHVDEMGTGVIRREVQKELCVQCHDKKNSPKFEGLFDLYYKKIVH